MAVASNRNLQAKLKKKKSVYTRLLPPTCCIELLGAQVCDATEAENIFKRWLHKTKGSII